MESREGSGTKRRRVFPGGGANGSGRGGTGGGARGGADKSDRVVGVREGYREVGDG
jgi:hypothetical protein